MAGPDATAPLILTLALDPAAFARLDAERRAHFPPGRNLIPAHLTLFHHLPGAELPAVAARLAQVAAATPPLALRVAGLRFLGRGVAYEIESPPLRALRAGLAEAWRDWLTPQDRQGWRPHVTVQNKAAPDAARALFEEMRADFAPWAAVGEGLLLWHYRGGPWDAAGRFGFRPV
ncbi:2'-5' RNA ligase family protein [Falsiroseomonas sp. CW058]|uniref:2'-5' RNA ligase family protein n=1 Tax=Falsiroseomonas sp. CW058 TaxID=3388664 RepID=UPI003D312F61